MEYTDEQAEGMLAGLTGPASQQEICQAIDEYFGAEHPLVLAGTQPLYNIMPFFLDVKDGHIHLADHRQYTPVLSKSKEIMRRTCQQQVDEMIGIIISMIEEYNNQE